MGPEYWQTVEEALGIMGKGMLGIFVVICNIVVDVLYCIIDPRVKISE